MNKILIALIGMVILVSGCTSQPLTGGLIVIPQDGSEQVNFKTADGFTIHGSFYKNTESKDALLLTHMIGSKRNVWSETAVELQKKYNVLAIDLRGHHQSIKQNGQTRLVEDFEDEDFAAMSRDFDAAKQYLRSKGLNIVGFVGASTSANVGFVNVYQDESIKGNVLLSPGTVYRGISLIKPITENAKPVLMIFSQGDIRSGVAPEKLFDRAGGEKELLISDSHLHGTDLLLEEGVQEKIIEWIEKTIPA